MARPSFRLKRILRLKTQLRKVAQDEIARVRRDLAVVEKGIADAETARTENLAAATEAALQGRAARDLQLHEVYDRGQREFGHTLRKKADALAEVAEAQRGILLERRREERQFECLDERQRTREEAMEARVVANLQDDLARRPKPTLQATQKKERAS
jgi:flagellar export protein FliJ